MTIVTTLKTTAEDILKEAKKETIEAKATAAKGKLKDKLRSIDLAKTALANLERELEVLVEQVNADLNV